jgi:hypothetical protein
METVNSQILKKQLLENIEKLPESDIQEILNFTKFKLVKKKKKDISTREAKLDPRKDPILKLIGLADIDPFADKIDQELYGQ